MHFWSRGHLAALGRPIPSLKQALCGMRLPEMQSGPDFNESKDGADSAARKAQFF